MKTRALSSSSAVLRRLVLHQRDERCAPLCITQDIVTKTRLETVFNICQQVRSRCVVGARWRVLEQAGIDLLSYLTAMFEIDQRMSVHFDNGIGMGETRVESGTREGSACAS